MVWCLQGSGAWGLKLGVQVLGLRASGLISYEDHRGRLFGNIHAFIARPCPNQQEL